MADSITYNPETHFLQPKITGYRQLTPNETQLINDIKKLERDALLMVSALEQEKTFDQRWVAIAKTDLQKGYMALVRAVARPGG